MIGILYILLCVALGRVLCGFFFKNLKKPALEAGLPAFLVQLPAWYLTGTLTMTWLVYLIAYLFQKAEEPLFYGNLIAGLLVGVLLALAVIFGKRTGKSGGDSGKIKDFFLGESPEKGIGPVLYSLIAVGFTAFLMFLTFKVVDGSIYVGYS